MTSLRSSRGVSRRSQYGTSPGTCRSLVPHAPEWHRKPMQDSRPAAPADPPARSATVNTWTRDLADGGVSSWQLLLLNRRFRQYLLTSVFSNLGTWLQGTAQTLLAFQLTHSAFGVGLITAGQFAGFLVLGPWSATVADWLGPKRVLIATQMVSAVVAGLLAVLQFAHLLSVAWLFSLAVVTGLAFTLALPVQNAMVSALVSGEQRKVALAMNSVSYNIGRMISPLLYVVGLASLGYGWAFALNAISFAVFALTIATVFPGEIVRAAKPAPGRPGLRLIIRRPRVMLLLLMVATITAADDPVQVLGPSLARQLSGGPDLLAAYFLSALGLGTLLGAVLLRRSTTARHAAASLIVLAVSIPLFALGHSLWLSLGMAVAAGVAGLWAGAAAQAKLLETVGERYWMQVMAYWAVAWAGTKPLASLADGWLASRYGTFEAAVILVLPAAAVAVLELFMSPRIRSRLKSLVHRYNALHEPI